MSLDVYLYHRVYSRNITHNLGEMAEAAGIYKHLWHPEEIDIWDAEDLIKPLEEGLARLKANPEKYKKYNPPNGWGDYESLVEFVGIYLKHCRLFPDAKVEVRI